MNVREKLAELGLTLPQAAAPVAAYVPAVRTAGTYAATGAAACGSAKPSSANFSRTVI